MKYVILFLALIGAATQAVADGYAPVEDKQTFLALTQGKELRNFFYGVRLSVLENGQIDGSAVGWDIAGTWSWEDGYFCREMNWGGDLIPYNCQLVEAQGDHRSRYGRVRVIQIAVGYPRSAEP